LAAELASCKQEVKTLQQQITALKKEVASEKAEHVKVQKKMLLEIPTQFQCF
jgi:uncharacterized protein YlxW (UPF0749 family)